LNPSQVLILPGWQNSGPAHWQSRWAAHSRNTHWVKAALLVAPGDAAREELRSVLTSWARVPMQRLPFKSILLGSHNDPYCSLARAQVFASAWGAEFIDYGATGHINGEFGLATVMVSTVDFLLLSFYRPW
jgi:predicted alpha/beta hydrolase family esterase